MSGHPLDLLESLRRAPVLRHLPLASLDALASRSVARELAAGERLIEEGATGRAVFLVLGGRLAIRQRIGPEEESVIALRERGEWVGELAFADAGPRAASVSAEGSARVLEVPREALLQAMQGSTEAGLDLLRLVTTRLRESDAARLQLLVKQNDQLATRNASLHRENSELRAQVDDTRGLERFLGSSPAARAVREAVRRAADSRVPVLIEGETGTGKELLARALHEGSERRRGPFVAINCGLFSETLLESELFGHARGAFTGASVSRPGLVETADGGTLFLDEVADMPRSLQSALLRFLELGEFRRVGETRTRHARPRVVAASPVSLEAAAADGRFRSDLLYRLDVLRIGIPPLRERREDIPLLLAHGLETIARRLGRPALSLSPDALEALCGYDFPGNVRELQNELERLHVALEPGAIATRADLSARIREHGRARPSGYAEAVRAFKTELIERALADAHGDRGVVAERLGLHRSNLSRMIRELGVAAPARSDGTRS